MLISSPSFCAADSTHNDLLKKKALTILEEAATDTTVLAETISSLPSENAITLALAVEALKVLEKETTPENATHLQRLRFQLTQDIINFMQAEGISLADISHAVRLPLIGPNAVTSGGTNNIVWGNGAQANPTSGDSAVALGKNAVAAVQDTIAIGSAATTTFQNGIAIGLNSLVTGTDAIAFGNGASASAARSVALGKNANTAQVDTIILGDSSNGAVAVGIGSSTPAGKLTVFGSASNPTLLVTSYANQSALLLSTTAGLPVLKMSTDPTQPALSIADASGNFAAAPAGTRMVVNGPVTSTSTSTITTLSVVGTSILTGLDVFGTSTFRANVTIASPSATGPSLIVTGTTNAATVQINGIPGQTNALLITNGGETITSGGLTISAGGANVTGATNINTSGTATTNIGTAGGATNIGSSTSSNTLQGTTRNIGASLFSATSGVVLTVTGNSAQPSTVLVGSSSTTAPALKLVNNPTAAITDFNLTINSSGAIKQSASSIQSQFILNGGQTGPLTIGTTDATSLNFETNGTKRLAIDANGDATIFNNRSLQLNNTNNSQGVFIQSSTGLVATYTLTLPVDTGTFNQVLTTNGLGRTSWQGGPETGNYIPFPQIGIQGASSSIAAPTTYAGGVYYLYQDVTFSNITVRTATTGTGNVTLAIYQGDNGTYNGSTAIPLKAFVNFTAPGTTNTSVTTPIGDTITLKAGIIFVLWGRTSATAIALTTYPVSAVGLLNTGFVGYPSAFTGGPAVTATPPATIDPSTFTAATTNVLPVLRLT